MISVLSGRRNNPPDDGIRPLCVYNPIHYQELPELFMDYVCSLTGKSPSTTGAGSEGALTKGPFNALCATADLNNALVSMLLSGYGGFSTRRATSGPSTASTTTSACSSPRSGAGSSPTSAIPKQLIEAGHLEKLEDYDLDGKRVLASRLGYRITSKFVHTFFGRVFDNPASVFTDEILRPETQDPAVFADGVNNIVEAQERVAAMYFEDGSIDDACPPLRALLHIMAYGKWEGKDAHHPEVRALFTRESLLGQRLVQGSPQGQAAARRPALEAPRDRARRVPRAFRATATRPFVSASAPVSSKPRPSSSASAPTPTARIFAAPSAPIPSTKAPPLRARSPAPSWKAPGPSRKPHLAKRCDETARRHDAKVEFRIGSLHSRTADLPALGFGLSEHLEERR